MSLVDTNNLVIILQKNKNTPPNESKLFNLSMRARPCPTSHGARYS